MKAETQIRDALAIVEGNQPAVEQAVRDALTQFGPGMDVDFAEKSVDYNLGKADALKWVLRTDTSTDPTDGSPE